MFIATPVKVLRRPLESALDAAIGVMDEAGRRIARFDRLVERVHGQARLEMVVERPSHNSAREGVDDDGEIDESLRQPDIEPVLGLDPRMMSATQSWSRSVGTSPRARLGAIGKGWRLSFVGATNGRLRKLKRLSARMSLSTRLALTTRPSSLSLRVMRR